MKVKMLRTVQGSPDGIRVNTYVAGEVYDEDTVPFVNDRLGNILVNGGLAEVPGQTKVAPDERETKVVDPASEHAAAPEEDEESSEEEEGPRTDLGDLTVAEVLSAVREGEISANLALAHERNGKQRTTLIHQLLEILQEG